MLIAARDNEFGVTDQERVVLDTVCEYRTAMRRYASMGNLDVWYDHLEIEPVLRRASGDFKPRTVKQGARTIAKARTRDSMSAFSKLTQVVDGEPRIADQSPLIVPMEALVAPDEYDELFEMLSRLLGAYRDTLDFDRRKLLDQFAMKHFARKVVGVGSVGTRAWIALLFGRDGNEPLFLQVKEAEASVLEESLGASEFANHGQRVVTGQRLMQASSDIFLGWVHVISPLDAKERDFYVRQLRDWKGSAEVDQMIPAGMAFYGKLCGQTLARAHARSGDRIAIAAYLGNGNTFDRAIVAFSKAYAEQNERDYGRLAAAVKSKEIEAQTGL
jgi:hypothetical protein